MVVISDAATLDPRKAHAVRFDLQRRASFFLQFCPVGTAQIFTLVLTPFLFFPCGNEAVEKS